jgi:DNA-damage-inducible protein J
MEVAMRTETIRIRVEPALKHQAEAIFKELGIRNSEAVRIFYRWVVASGGLPFDAKVPNIETMRAILAEPEERAYSSFSEVRKDADV